MIVVDVGCMPHGNEESVYRLVERFNPEILFGFDPHPDLVEGIEWLPVGAFIVRRRAAAWTRTEPVAFRLDADEGVADIASGITRFGDPDHFVVDGIDLAGFIAALPLGDEGIVLKIDAEGAEYVLLRDLHDRGIDERLSLVLVEWHSQEMSHDMFLSEKPSLRCIVEEWK